MKVTPIPHGLDLQASDLVRSPGLHMSEIFNTLYQKLDPGKQGWADPELFLAGAMGTAWEKQVEFLLTKSGVEAQRPQEFRTTEGIAFSPDLLIYEPGKLRLGEIKLKWMSTKDMPRQPSSRFPPKFDKIITQMMSYCAALETPYARLYANFVIGNYCKPYKPELLVWDIEFSPREMRDEWQAMMNHARHARLL